MPKIIDHEARRAEIGRAAALVIGRNGLERTKLIDVAREAGCTTGAVSHYFPDKDAVLVAALEYSLSGLAAARPYTTADFGNDPVAELVYYMCSSLPVEEQLRLNWKVWLAFAGRAAHDERLARVHEAAYAELQEGLANFLRESGIETDHERAADVAMSLLAIIDGIGLRAVLEPAAWPAERQRERLTALIEPYLYATRAAQSALPKEDSP